MQVRAFPALLSGAALLLSSCSGGGGASPAIVAPTPTPTPSASATPTSVFTAPGAESLSVADVQAVVAHAAAEARARGKPAFIVVSDRVGNMLAIFRMTGSPLDSVIQGAPNGQNIDAQGLTIPSGGGAIAKAITGAYLSSGGNAFSTRTASMIVQEHFPVAPNTAGLESGPLFGVQFSSLPCSDFSARYAQTGVDQFIGPKRSPLGLSADPGGFPLYKNGVLVGGIGVMADGLYSFDHNVADVDDDVEEQIALAGTIGFEAPVGIRADRISVDGTQLRYTDTPYSRLLTNGTATYAETAPALGSLVSVRGYYGIGVPAIVPGTVYGSEQSGIRRATAAEFANPDAFIMTDGFGNNRFPVRAGTDAAEVAQPLTQAEVRAILEEAFTIMSRARGQIRQPLDSRAQVSISAVDTRGSILGIVRGPDAGIFGTDVSLQKARTAAFFSGQRAAASLMGNPSADVRAFVGRVRTFLNDPTALTGAFAFADRSGGNLSRPYFPDGQVGRPNGPLSRSIAQFNPFSTGLQSALIIDNLGQHLDFVTARALNDTPRRCTFAPDVAPGQNPLQNGIQIFPGSVPIYRGNVLVGAVGVSGDGIDQDDMISFLGTHNGGIRVGGVGNAPTAIRADQIIVNLGNAQSRLRYVSCPFAPFLDTAQQNVCSGL